MAGRHGNSNASHRRKLAQEALRLKIDGTKSINEIHACAEEICEPDADVQRITARAEIHFKLLRKVLPDLRSVEIAGDGGEPIKMMVEFVQGPVS